MQCLVQQFALVFSILIAEFNVTNCNSEIYDFVMLRIKVGQSFPKCVGSPRLMELFLSVTFTAKKHDFHTSTMYRFVHVQTYMSKR